MCVDSDQANRTFGLIRTGSSTTSTILAVVGRSAGTGGNSTEAETATAAEGAFDPV